MEKLPKCEANYTALTPITFLKRAARFYGGRTSIIYGTHTSFTWLQTYHRCLSLASSLRSLGIAKNDVVSVIAPNIPALYELHFAAPMAGAVLNTINTRLDAATIATLLRHSSAKLLFVDYEFLSLALHSLLLLSGNSSSGNPTPPPLLILIDDLDSPSTAASRHLQYQHLLLSARTAKAPSSSAPLLVKEYVDSPEGLRLGRGSELEYEELVRAGDVGFEPQVVTDEWDPITLNYTSGTTSSPKGVVYSHRGAYLSTMSMIMAWEMGREPVYLWTLPMFHCNGWTFTWGIAARGGTNVCIRTTASAEIYRSIALHGVTRMCCAPIVFNSLLDEAFSGEVLRRPVNILTGGAPPPAALLERIEKRGFHVVHAYGLTEATGPALVCEWKREWDNLARESQARIKARQGISVVTVADVDLKSLETNQSVPHDGNTMGEIVLRGSGIMKGYLNNAAATAEALDGGWFRTGDVGVVHPDGYIEIKDRAKDVIISGGENISSKEVEEVIFRHPRVAETAVVAMPHPKWGESPCAFVVLKDRKEKDEKAVEKELIEHCRENMAHYMVPKKVAVVKKLPWQNNKVLKRELREIAKTFTAVDATAEKDCSSGGGGGDAAVREQGQPQQIFAMSRL